MTLSKLTEGFRSRSGSWLSAADSNCRTDLKVSVLRHGGEISGPVNYV